MNFCGKRILVYGLGISGQAVCKLLHLQGACVSVYDDENRFGNLFPFEKNPLSKEFDMVVVSPGIKVHGNKLIAHFALKRTKILSELDVGYLFCKGKIIGITGTNGKTTVTSLVGDIFRCAGRESVVCGNIGIPLATVAGNLSKTGVAICEVSNFQLELSSLFKADACAILNLAPDHLDRHSSEEEYYQIKRKIISGKRSQKVVLNFDDERVKNINLRKNTLFFSKKQLKKGVFVKNNAIFHNRTRVISLSEIPLFGEKNLENVLAAIALARVFHIKPKQIRHAILSYKAPQHRLEYLGKVQGADIFDDSKATNISAVISAIASVGADGLVLMLGGQNKDFEFDEIFNKGYPFERVISFGQSGEEIALCGEKYGYEVVHFSTMKEACLFAKQNIQSGQKLLLSPACASFDEFSSYAVRGRVFKEIMFGEEDIVEIEG